MGWLRRAKQVTWRELPHELPAEPGRAVQVIRDADAYAELERADVERALAEAPDQNPHDGLRYPVGDELEFEFAGELLVRIAAPVAHARVSSITRDGDALHVALASSGDAAGSSVLNLALPAAADVRASIDGRALG